MSEEMNAFISVIVPVYNAEKWLRTCVESICAQTYPFLEIILIDDGSTDSSLRICQELAGKDPRIRVVAKPNSGVSDSRNVGILMATGKYISFVDADDYLQLEVLEKAVACMKNGSVHLCAWNVSCVKGEANKAEPDIVEGIIHRRDAVTAIIYDRCTDVRFGRYFRASWGKLFCSHIIKENQILFPTQQKLGEDALFLLEYISHIEHIIGINFVGYFYRISETSAVRKYRTDLLCQNQMQMDAIAVYLEKHPEFYSVQTRTAQTCLAWDMYRRLIRNGLVGKQTDREIAAKARIEAGSWYKQNKEILQQKNISRKKMPKISRLQYFLGGWMSQPLLYIVTEQLEKRKMISIK